MTRGKRLLALFLLLPSLALAPACTRVENPATGEAEFTTLTPEQERQIGEQEHPRVLQQFGGAYPDEELQAEIRGRDLVSGLPKTILVSDAEIREAIEEPVSSIVSAVRNTLDRTPPELASDIMERGIVVAGGGGLLRCMVERFRAETGMPVALAPEPLQAVAEGAGKCLEEFETLKRVLISTSRQGGSS